MCGNFHVLKIIKYLIGNEHCNVYYSKSKVHKSMPLLHGSIIMNDERLLITIDGKWLEAFVHITKATFLNLPCLIQIELHFNSHLCQIFIIAHIYIYWFS